MRRRLLAAVFLICLAFVTPAKAEIVNVDPLQELSTSLEPAEVGKIAALQGAVFPYLGSSETLDLIAWSWQVGPKHLAEHSR